jgi:hypothetical protein
VADDEYPPHPLVTELAMGLTRNDYGDLSDTGKEFVQAQNNLTTSRPSKARQEAFDAAARKLAKEIATDANLPELHTFAGFIGAALEDSTGTTDFWRLLYLDAKLRTWLLVDQKGIALAKSEVADETSPFGTRDHLWVKSDASVSQGEGGLQTNEIQARFMRGAFVSAAEFAASVSGGTFASVTGPACPLTPGCCGIRTR